MFLPVCSGSTAAWPAFAPGETWPGCGSLQGGSHFGSVSDGKPNLNQNWLMSGSENLLLSFSQVYLEVRVAGCGPTVALCPSPGWGGRRRAVAVAAAVAASLRTALTACWLKTPEAGSLRAALLKLSTRSSVRLQLTLTETQLLQPERLIFKDTQQMLLCTLVPVFVIIKRDAPIKTRLFITGTEITDYSAFKTERHKSSLITRERF